MAGRPEQAARARRARAVEVGERVLLCRVAERDGPDLRRLRRESWPFLAPWEPTPAPGTSPAGERWFQGFLRTSRRRDVERLLLCDASDGAVLGQIGISNIVRGAFHSACLGYWIGERHAGRGTMTEGLQLALRFAFDTLGLHRVEANLRPENAASRALVRRAGFTKEGYSPRYLKIAGRWCDHERWALLVDDWAGR